MSKGLKWRQQRQGWHGDEQGRETVGGSCDAWGGGGGGGGAAIKTLKGGSMEVGGEGRSGIRIGAALSREGTKEV